MRKSTLRVAVPAAVTVALFGCAQQGTEGATLAPGEKLQITQDVWNEYQDYVKEGRKLGPDRKGAFGVVLVGDVGVVGLYAYRYCPRTFDGCFPGGGNGVSKVLDACRREQVECLIFARNDEIQVPYEIID
jgi:hypothetical protein